MRAVTYKSNLTNEKIPDYFIYDLPLAFILLDRIRPKISPLCIKIKFDKKTTFCLLINNII